MLHEPPAATAGATTPCFEPVAAWAALRQCNEGSEPSNQCKSWYDSRSALYRGVGACFTLPPGWSDAEEERARRCLSPVRSSGLPAFFNMGDSHAGAVELGLHQAIGGRMVFAGLQRGACPWGPHHPCEQDRRRDARAYHLAATDLLRANLRAGDVVSIISAQNAHLNNESLGWYARVVIPMLSERGASLLLLEDYVKPASVFCSRWKTQRAECVVSPTQHLLSLTAAGSRFAREHAGVYAWSLAPLFCSEPFTHSSRCSTFVPASRPRAGFIDGSHLNAVGSKYLWPFACATFESFGFFSSPLPIASNLTQPSPDQ